jgi:hypothetical protein
MFHDVEYEVMAELSPDELAAFYDRQRHLTTHDADKLRALIANTYCLVTARRGGDLIGLARGITDGVWGCLVECKLDPAHQGPACLTKTDGRIEHDSLGIAHEMARRVIDALRHSGVERIMVMAHETEVDFCEELGFKRVKGMDVLSFDAAAGVVPARATSEFHAAP